jgi:hypothetical protein
MHPLEKSKFIIGYLRAQEFTGIPVRRLQRLVESRQVRVIKPNQKTVMFVPEHLLEDLMGMEVSKL